MTALLRLCLALQLGSDPSQLINQLGSPRFVEREAAGAALQGLGRQAVSALRQAQRSQDAEVATRASALLDQIETQMLVEPSLVRLEFRDRPLPEVLKSLGEQSGWTIGFAAEAGPQFSQRRVTLEASKPVPYWEAIDQIARLVPCQVATGMNQGGFGPGNAAQAAVQLIPAKPGLIPSSTSGPFRTTVFKIHHERNREFFAGLPAQFVFNQGFAGVVPQPARAVEGRPAGTNEAAGEFQEQFVVGLQLLAEPRLSMVQSGAMKIMTAVDETGLSLATADPTATPLPGLGMNPYGIVGGSQLIVPVPLLLPEAHGKWIKRLKGEVPVLVHSRKENPQVLKLADAKDKPVELPGLSVQVHEIKTVPNQPFISIEMTVKAKGNVEPGQLQNGFGPEFPIFRNNMGQSQSQIEFVDAQGRLYPQWYTFNPQATNEGLRLTVRLVPGEGLGPPAELRHYELARAESVVTFDLENIPMP